MPHSTNTAAEPNGTAIAALQKAGITEHQVPEDSYPPVSSLKQTCPLRLFQAENDRTSNADDTPEDTILYLAYGSNMSAQTFLGMRKVRPLSEMNVSVPSLRLTFDLPGIAYREPCFANVEFRKESEKQKTQLEDGDEWDGRLLGVVYEVTKEDYRNIMRTEGGGTSYQEIMIPCVPIPSKQQENETQKFPETFIARTLYAPRLSKTEDKNRSWWDRLTTGPYRPDSSYSQPSERYLKLLRTGAREHELPTFYQKYLNELQPYTRTTRSQNIGQVIFLLVWAPSILLAVRGFGIFADETGRLPKGLGKIVTILFNMAWISYDYLFKPIWGDGERTIPDQNKLALLKEGRDVSKGLLSKEKLAFQ